MPAFATTPSGEQPWLARLSPTLTPEALWRRLLAVLAQSAEHLEQLERLAAHWAADDADPFIRVVDRIVMETALLALVTARVPSPPPAFAPLLERVLAAIAPIAHGPRSEVLLMRFPSTSASLGIAPIVLDRLGRGRARFVDLVGSALARGHAHAVERLPFREMDLRWVVELAGGCAQRYDDLVPQSLLARRVHPIYMSRADGHAYTHALMYLSDFGGRPLLPAVDRREVSATIDACLALHLFTEDLDLLAEFVIAGLTLDLPPSPHMRLAWHMIERAWDDFGCLPGPSFQADDFRALAGDAARAYAFRHTYHTGYVGAMLCAMLLGRAAEPTPAWRPRDRVDVQAAAACTAASRLAAGFCRDDLRTHAARPPGDPLAILTALARHLARAGKHHCLMIAAGAPLDHEELAMVLGDAVLIRAAREYDLAALGAALETAASGGLPVSATVGAAAEFLARQGLECGALGAYFVEARSRESAAAIEVTRGLVVGLDAAAQRLGQVGGRRA